MAVDRHGNLLAASTTPDQTVVVARRFQRSGDGWPKLGDLVVDLLLAATKTAGSAIPEISVLEARISAGRADMTVTEMSDALRRVGLSRMVSAAHAGGGVEIPTSDFAYFDDDDDLTDVVVTVGEWTEEHDRELREMLRFDPFSRRLAANF